MIVDSHSNPDRVQGDHGLVPLINVVFLLLAFFMIAGQIQRADAVRVRPPVSVSESVAAEHRAELVVDVDGVAYLEGRAVALDELGAALGSLIAVNAPGGEVPEDAGNPALLADAGDLSVLVKADADLEVAKLEAVLAELMRAGVSRAALATTPDRR